MVKSGINWCGVKVINNFPPEHRYQMARINNSAEGIRIPIRKPNFAIFCVYLVPPNWENVTNQKTINTPQNLTHALLVKAGQLTTKIMLLK